MTSGDTRARRIPRLFHFVALAVPIAVLIVACLVLPGWIPLLPRVIRRGMTEALLRAVLVAYSAIFLASFVGTPLSAWLLARSRQTKKSRPWLGRAFLVCFSCLCSFLLLEIGSAGVRTWLHRLPILPTNFEASPPDEYRILVMGGSSALGEPYRPWLSVGQIVAWQLQQAVPNRRFECQVLAWLGESLEMQHRKLATLKRRPDAVIIYSGHNEFASRFEEERDPWLDEEPRTWLFQRVYQATLISPFCRLVYEVISKNRLDSPPPLSGRHQLIDPPLCSPSESAEILADFRRRLEVIVSYCEQIGALPILIIPPANEAGYEPSRSTVPANVSRDERRRLVADFEIARSAAGCRAILERHADFAEAHFRLARLLEKEGRLTEAGHHYLASLDNDGLPIRCPALFRDAYVEVANRHPRSILIDGRHELSAVSPTGLLGDEVIHDTHHPTLRGYVALASAVLRELPIGKIFGPSSSIALPLDPTVCANHFGMDNSKWATVCERTSVHYQRVAGYRYDPAERLGKSLRYAEAAKRIRSGTAPDALAFPGIGGKGTPGKPGK